MIEIKEINDIEQLMAWRAEVIRNVFKVNPDTRLLEENRRYYLCHVPNIRDRCRI